MGGWGGGGGAAGEYLVDQALVHLVVCTRGDRARRVRDPRSRSHGRRRLEGRRARRAFRVPAQLSDRPRSTGRSPSARGRISPPSCAACGWVHAPPQPRILPFTGRLPFAHPNIYLPTGKGHFTAPPGSCPSAAGGARRHRGRPVIAKRIHHGDEGRGRRPDRQRRGRPATAGARGWRRWGCSRRRRGGCANWRSGGGGS